MVDFFFALHIVECCDLDCTEVLPHRHWTWESTVAEQRRNSLSCLLPLENWVHLQENISSRWLFVWWAMSNKQPVQVPVLKSSPEFKQHRFVAFLIWIFSHFQVKVFIFSSILWSKRFWWSSQRQRANISPGFTPTTDTSSFWEILIPQIFPRQLWDLISLSGFGSALESHSSRTWLILPCKVPKPS